mmetsp:Transcript_809/g.2004  ORF Transcript_809/g.2004 Transcript_809/m.2004 type:complete len:250 (-) Transcript_809:59-808(-)
MASVPSTRPLRILALHAFRTNGAIFKMQMTMNRQLECLDFADFEFLDAQHECSPDEERRQDPGVLQFFPKADFGPYREWWNAREAASGVVLDRFDDVISHVAQTLACAEPAFDGIVGFSQGGAVAVAIAVKQLSGELLPKAPPLRFIWVQGGMIPRHPSIVGALDGALDVSGEGGEGFELQVLATANAGDRVVPPGMTRRVASAFRGTYVEREGGGHTPVRMVENDEQTTAILDFFHRQIQSKAARLEK